MAWQFPTSISTNGTIALDLSTADSAFIAKGVLVAATDSVAVYAQGSFQQVVVAGTVASTVGAAIQLGSLASATSHDNSLTVEAGGEIRHFGSGSTTTAVRLTCYQSHLANAGLIASDIIGIRVQGISSTTVTTIVNSGTILAGDMAIARSSTSTETVMFTNTGTLSATTAYGFYTIDLAAASDLITNRGRIFGTIDLGSGNDVYSGAAGRLTGHLFAGAGDDVAVGGIDNDWLEGGADNDTLIGNAGNDRLNGGANNDKLFGGAGIDSLTSGANADIFVFNTALNASTNRDIIADFSHADDTFQLENAVFTKLGAGVHVLGAAFFRAGAAAADANDYIVYNRATGVLSYDANGNAAGGAIAFAVLVNKPVLAADDFVVI
jgi:Ca2+-binding RTX toxin-like protein